MLSGFEFFSITNKMRSPLHTLQLPASLLFTFPPHHLFSHHYSLPLLPWLRKSPLISCLLLLYIILSFIHALFCSSLSLPPSFVFIAPAFCSFSSHLIFPLVPLCLTLSLSDTQSLFLSPPPKKKPKTHSHSVLVSSFRRSFFNGNIFQMGKTHSALKYPRGLWAPLCSLNLLMLSSHIQICMMPYSTGCKKACIWLNKYVHWLKGLVWHHRASAFSVMLMKWRLNYKSAWYKIS